MSARLKNALHLRRAGRRREALALFRELAKAYPNDPILRFELAQTLDNMSREREAIPHYHHALRLDRKHPARYEIFLYLASSYRKSARPAAARRWLKMADAMGRSSPLAEKLHRLLDRK
jgi:predicted Zn-dependent protease